MKDFLKYGAIGLLFYAGMRYYKAYKLGSKLNISFASIMANGINKNNFSIGVNINVENKSGDNITLSNSNLKCYINGRYVGNCVVPYTQIIKANSTTKIFVVCDVMYKSAFADWWNLFIEVATTVKLTIAGSLRFNGVYVPIPAIDIKEFSIGDIFNNSKISGLDGFKNSPYNYKILLIKPINGKFTKKDRNIIVNELSNNNYHFGLSLIESQNIGEGIIYADKEKMKDIQEILYSVISILPKDYEVKFFYEKEMILRNYQDWNDLFYSGHEIK